MKYRILLLGLLLAGLAVSCQLAGGLLQSRPTVTPSASPTATVTPSPTATPTPTPTPTPIPAVRVESGEAALRNGDWETALVEFETARRDSREADIQSAALLGIGRTQLLSKKPLEAVDTLQSLIDAYPESAHRPYAHFFMGQALNELERYADAADAYLGYLTLRPGLVDSYVLEMRGDALFAAGEYSTAILDYQGALGSSGLNDRLLIEMKVARSYALSGDHTTAIVLYDDLYNRTQNEYTRALIDLRRGQSYTALGQYEEAYAVYLDAVNNYPTSYDSYSALLALVEAGVPVDDLQRGIVDYHAGQYGVALAAFDRYLQNNPADPGTARYYNGLATRALGGYQGAVDEWDRLIQSDPDHRFWAEAWDQKAQTQWQYLDQYTLAIQTYLDFAELVPAHPRAPEFLFDAASIAENFGNLDQAARLWEQVTIDYPEYEGNYRALFLAALCRYRQEDYGAAKTLFERVQGLSVNLGDRAKAYFWIAKTLQASGDEAGALSAWEQAASTDPTGYYSERARDILMGRPAFTPPQVYDLAVDHEAERRKAEEWMRARFLLPEDIDLNGLGELAQNPGVIRGSELWKLGLYNLAQTEFEALRQTIQDDPVLTYRLANYLTELGLHRSAIFAARRVLDLAGMSDYDTMTAPAYFNHLRFGTYYDDLILPVAQEYGFHPLLVFSVVRQESLFESFVRSSASAIGLMQIIPTTGQDIARNMGWPPEYTTEDLERPLINVRFGVDYLDTQRTLFDGDMYAVLAAYNGGPGNSLAWKKLAPDDPDLFLEVIRFEETRTYIRRIYEIFSIYRRLYDRTP